MTIADAGPAGFSIGRVINRLFSVLGRNLIMFLLLSALLVGAPTALVNIGQLSMAATAGSGAMLAAQLALVVGGLMVSVVCNAVLQGAVIHATVNDLAGRKASLGESLAVGLRYFLPLVGISLIVAIGCGFGFIFLIIPGILLALAWCVAAPAEVMERAGVFGSLSRSLELTRDHRGAIFVLGLGYFVLVWIVGAAITAVAFTIGLGAGFTATGGRALAGVQTVAWVQAGFSLVANTVLASLSSAGIASIYFELRHSKEGVGVEQLAAVFD